MTGVTRPGDVRRLAVVGTGIAGLVACHHLHSRYDLTVFEAGDHVGGHTHTHDVEHAGERHAIDTGFIVFNARTYPNFCALLDELGVAWQDSDMSFSVRDAETGLEYNGTSLNTLFAQRGNLLRPRFWGMIRDILRFNEEAPKLLEGDDDSLSLGDYLTRNGYGEAFVEQYVIPMGAAIWSAEPRRMREFPARYFVRFFANHGFLSVDDRPVWRVVKGGSRSYVGPLTAPFADRIRIDTPVASVRRHADGVDVTLVGATEPERFDGVVFATHSDQALALLGDDATDAEREIVGAIPYQRNEALLHTDTSVMPKRELAWAAWNYHRVPQREDLPVAVTYDMNILQGLTSDTTYLVTLNPAERIDPSKVIKSLVYHHPVYTPEGIAAQRRHDEVSGRNRTWYCGAWWGFGFHEDGVRSGLRVARQLGVGEAVDAFDAVGASA